MSRKSGMAMGALGAALALWWFEKRVAAIEDERGEVIFSNRPLA